MCLYNLLSSLTVFIPYMFPKGISPHGLAWICIIIYQDQNVFE